jgi:hypothetical protein
MTGSRETCGSALRESNSMHGVISLMTLLDDACICFADAISSRLHDVNLWIPGKDCTRRALPCFTSMWRRLAVGGTQLGLWLPQPKKGLWSRFPWCTVTCTRQKNHVSNRYWGQHSFHAEMTWVNGYTGMKGAGACRRDAAQTAGRDEKAGWNQGHGSSFRWQSEIPQLCIVIFELHICSQVPGKLPNPPKLVVVPLWKEKNILSSQNAQMRGKWDKILGKPLSHGMQSQAPFCSYTSTWYLNVFARQRSAKKNGTVSTGKKLSCGERLHKAACKRSRLEENTEPPSKHACE